MFNSSFVEIEISLRLCLVNFKFCLHLVMCLGLLLTI